MTPAAKARPSPPITMMMMTRHIIRVHIRVNIHTSIGPEPVQPCVVIGWIVGRELGRVDRAGIGRIRRVIGIIIGGIGPLLIYRLVAGSQGGRDQDKPYAAGFFHNGLAVLKILHDHATSRYPVVMGWLFKRYCLLMCGRCTGGYCDRTAEVFHGGSENYPPLCFFIPTRASPSSSYPLNR